MSRVTVNINDKLESDLKKFAVSQKQSVSKIASKAIEYYLNAVKRRELGRKENAPPDAVKGLEAGRIDC